MVAVSDPIDEVTCHLLWKIFSPVFLIGAVGNVLSLVVVLVTPSFRTSPIGFSLCALSFIDTGVLVTSLLKHWLPNIEQTSNFACRTQSFIGYLLTHLSSWTVALMSADRAVSVARPLTRLPSAAENSRRRLMTVWVVLLVILIGINGHIFWTRKLLTDTEEIKKFLEMANKKTVGGMSPTTATVTSPGTTEVEKPHFEGLFTTGTDRATTIADDGVSNSSATDYNDGLGVCDVAIPLWKIWTRVDIVVWAIIPFIIIAVSNSIVIFYVLNDSFSIKNGCCSADVDNVTSTSVIESNLTGHEFFLASSSANRSSQKIGNSGATLLCVSCVFLLSTLPMIVYMVLYELYAATNDAETSRNLLMNCICKLIYYIGLSSNFLLYCFAGTRFRLALRSLIYRCFRGGRGTVTESFSPQMSVEPSLNRQMTSSDRVSCRRQVTTCSNVQSNGIL